MQIWANTGTAATPPSWTIDKGSLCNSCYHHCIYESGVLYESFFFTHCSRKAFKSVLHLVVKTYAPDLSSKIISLFLALTLYNQALDWNLLKCCINIELSNWHNPLWTNPLYRAIYCIEPTHLHCAVTYTLSNNHLQLQFNFCGSYLCYRFCCFCSNTHLRSSPTNSACCSLLTFTSAVQLSYSRLRVYFIALNIEVFPHIPVVTNLVYVWCGLLYSTDALLHVCGLVHFCFVVWVEEFSIVTNTFP